MAISKLDTRFFISSLIGLKFCTRIDGDNTQNRIGVKILIMCKKFSNFWHE